MSKTEEFKKHIEPDYTFKGDSIVLGTGILENEPIQQSHIEKRR